MNRKTERKFTFKLLFMSDFYEKKELGNELLLYFDAPFPFEDNEETKETVESASLKESINDEDRRRITARYAEIVDKLEQRHVISAPVAGEQKRIILIMDELPPKTTDGENK